MKGISSIEHSLNEYYSDEELCEEDVKKVEYSQVE